MSRAAAFWDRLPQVIAAQLLVSGDHQASPPATANNGDGCITMSLSDLSPGRDIGASQVLNPNLPVEH